MKMIFNKKHMLVKPIFSLPKLDGSNTATGNSVKYDIHTREYHVFIEVKPNRKSIEEIDLQEEFGSDIYPYDIRNVYDKNNVTRNINSVIKLYASNGNYFCKKPGEIVVQQEQVQSINSISSRQVQQSKTFNTTLNLAKKNYFGNVLDILA